MTAKTVTIAGDSFEILFKTLKVSLAAGAEGCRASFEVMSFDNAQPQQDDPVSFNIGGINFLGRLASCQETGEGQDVRLQVTALGAQERIIKRQIEMTYRTGTSVGTILGDLLFNTGMSSTIVGTNRTTAGFSFAGTVMEAIASLAVKNNYHFWITPAGNIEFVDRETPPTWPFDWDVSNDEHFSDLQKSRSSDFPVTKITVQGGVQKLDVTDPDSETRTLSFVGDGLNQWFDYPSITDEITDVRLNTVSQSITYQGSGLEGSRDVVNYRREYRLYFNSPPADGDSIEVDLTIQYATAEWEDSARQTQLQTDYPGFDGIIEYVESRPEIRTTLEAQALADSLGELLGGIQYTASAVVWGSSLFYPCRSGSVIDSRSLFSATGMFIDRNDLTWDTGWDNWEQSLSATNGLLSGSPGGVGGVIAGAVKAVRQAPQDKQPPTETSPANTPKFDMPASIAFDAAGNCYIVDSNNHRIRKVSAGILSTYGGTGVAGSDGDGGLVSAAKVTLAQAYNSLVFDGTDLFLVESSGVNPCVRKIALATGEISLFAGNRVSGPSGWSGGPAVASSFGCPLTVIKRSDGKYVISDSNDWLRLVDGSGNGTTLYDTLSGWTVDAIVAFGDDTRFLRYQSGNKVMYSQIDSAGVLTDLATVWPASATPEHSFYDLCRDAGGNLYWSDHGQHKIYQMDGSYVVTHLAGTGGVGYSGDGGPAVDAQINYPNGMTVHAGYLYFCDGGNHCVRRINLGTGMISLFAGTPEQAGYSGDGGPSA